MSRRGDRAAEGAALEMPCAGRTPVPWVQIPPPPPLIFGVGAHPRPTVGESMRSMEDPGVTVLDGEVAVPCSPQSALAGSNSLSRAVRFE